MTRDEFRIETVDHIDYGVEPYAWPFAKDHAAQIDADWEKLRAAKPALFNGRVMLMHSDRIEADAHGRVLRGAAFETNYKSFLAWRSMGCPDAHVSNCFAMAALRSADGAFLLGRMGVHTAAPGRIYFPAGTPDEADVKGGRVDFEGSALRELNEETGLRAADVAVAPDWTVVFDGRYVACMKTMRSSETAATLIARFKEFAAKEKEPELTELVPVFSKADFDPVHMPKFMLEYMLRKM